MYGIASSSVIFKPPKQVQIKAQGCFCDKDPSTGTHLELYPRPDNTVYVCGIGGSPHLQKEEIVKLRGSTVEFNQARKEKVLLALERVLEGQVMPDIKDESAFTFQCCMRPCAPDALPILGRLNSTENVTFCTGLNCWGITYSPACGWILSKLLLAGKSPLNLEAFSPARFQREWG
jgi:glycine/D-amino acid oxidase-like deaminating enzyme